MLECNIGPNMHTMSHMWLTGLEPLPNSAKGNSAHNSGINSSYNSRLPFYMVAEQWSWKHPGELQQAEGLIPEHWGTLNNSWSNKG